jgi:hypothetical protein
MISALTIVMVLCLVGEGAFIFLMGFPFPGSPLSLYLAGLLWIVECASIAIYKGHPVYAMIAGWLMFGYMAEALSRNTVVRHSVTSFLYQHSLELLFILASHLAYFARFREQSRQRRVPVAP